MATPMRTVDGSEVETKTTQIGARPEERSIELTESMRERITANAYVLYEERGRREGCAMQDWLDAEYIVNKEMYETH